MSEPQNPSGIAQPEWVTYLDLSGGRNTKRDPHALDRNQLAVSDNTWMQTGNALSKRPGNAAVQISTGSFGAASSAISLGSTGSGVPAAGMAEGRFAGQTCLVVQGIDNQIYAASLNPGGPSLTTWVSIGKVSAGSISAGSIMAAQLFDPDPTSSNTMDGSLFLVNGVDTPKVWYGPGNILKPVVTAQLPQKTGTSLPITPKYVASLFSSLFYAGEPTDPSAVYVSNPFLPQQFTQNMLIPTGTITNTSYIPAYIGRGDGVDGGVITGLARMGSAMIVYKESAIYAMTQVGVIGDSLWGSSVVSSSVGSVSPRALVPFDNFHVFLGIDGVYTFDGQQTRRISENNPDLFDGPVAQILNRKSAIGVRYGNRYIIFFDNGNMTGQALGYPCAGAWFDFGKVDVDGFPAVGTISAMNVAGIAALRGANDLGNFAWADAVIDRVGTFNAQSNGFSLSSDFTAAISTNVLGKADLFTDSSISYTDRFATEAPEDLKVVDSAHLYMSFPIVTGGQQYTFSGTMYLDQLMSQTSSASSQPIPAAGTAIVGSAVVGTAVLGAGLGTPVYQNIPLYQQNSASGYIIQFGFAESSVYPWTSLGYGLLMNRQRRVGTASG